MYTSSTSPTHTCTSPRWPDGCLLLASPSEQVLGGHPGGPDTRGPVAVEMTQATAAAPRTGELLRANTVGSLRAARARSRRIAVRCSASNSASAPLANGSRLRGSVTSRSPLTMAADPAAHPTETPHAGSGTAAAPARRAAGAPAVRSGVGAAAGVPGCGHASSSARSDPTETKPSHHLGGWTSRTATTGGMAVRPRDLNRHRTASMLGKVASETRSLAITVNRRAPQRGRPMHSGASGPCSMR